MLSLAGVLRRVRELRRHRERSEWSGDEELVFPSLVGTPLSHSNVLSRVLRPIAEEAGAPWAGFHAFRHTCASMLFERGANAKQVQKWLGHHSAAFTLSKYIHLLGDELGEPLAIDTELAGATVGATSVTELTREAGAPVEADSAQEAEFAIQHKPAPARDDCITLDAVVRSELDRPVAAHIHTAGGIAARLQQRQDSRKGIHRAFLL